MSGPSRPQYLMERMSVRDMREALSRTQTIILPIGVVEQHGYHLPLTTDTITACELAARAAEKAGCVVAPPVNYNFSGGTLPGTINVSPQVFSLLIQDICRSLAAQGFRNIILLSGHGGSESVQALRDAADMLLRLSDGLDELNIAVPCFWEISPTAVESFKEKDYHAGYMETSMMLYWRPELVGDEYITDKADILDMMRQDPDSYQLKRKNIDDNAVRPHTTQHPDIEVGVMGDPGSASREIGERFARETVEYLVGLVEKLESGKG